MTMTAPSRSPRLLLTLALPGLLTLAACGGGDDAADGAEWAGTIEDSAGVQIVRNPDQGTWGADGGMRLVEELRIGRAEGDPNYQFGLVGSVDVDAAGNIYVLDQLAQSVRMYDSAGTFVRSLGRPGSGPGELSRAASAVLVTAGDTIAVPDVMLQRLSRFTPDGADAGSVPMMMQDGIPLRWEHGGEGRLIVQTMRIPMPNATNEAGPNNVIVERDLAGTMRDTLKVLAPSESFEMQGQTPVIRIFFPESIWSPRDAGGVAVALNNQYRVELYDADGRLERVIVRDDLAASPVSDADKSTLRERMSEMMVEQGAPPPVVQMMTQNMQFGDQFPVLNQLARGPNGTLWVQRVRPASEMDFSGSGMAALDMGARDWDVYDAEGRLLGAVNFPDRFTLLRVRDDAIYGISRDDLDVASVVRLRIQAGTAESQ